MEKYLTFDCYGTLVNEEGLYSKIEDIAKKIGVDQRRARHEFIQYQDSRSNMHPYLDYDLLTRNNLIHMDFLFGLKHQFERYYVEVLIAHRELKPFTEVIPTLNKFIDMGYKLIIMSNSSWDIIPHNVKSLEVPFEVVTAEDVHAYKPDLDFFEAVQNKYNFSNENHYHIAQGYGSDVIPCKRMNWNNIWVNRDHEKPSTDILPTYEIHKLDEALKYLK